MTANTNEARALLLQALIEANKCHTSALEAVNNLLQLLDNRISKLEQKANTESAEKSLAKVEIGPLYPDFQIGQVWLRQLTRYHNGELPALKQRLSVIEKITGNDNDKRVKFIGSGRTSLAHDFPRKAICVMLHAANLRDAEIVKIIFEKLKTTDAVSKYLTQEEQGLLSK